jgi:hypothetical protein
MTINPNPMVRYTEYWIEVSNRKNCYIPTRTEQVGKELFIKFKKKFEPTGIYAPKNCPAMLKSQKIK